MLVLTRKSGEAIHIGDDIVVKVSDISGNRVKLCIDAPKIMRILRAEVAEQMEREVSLRDESSLSSPRKERERSSARATYAAK